MGFPQALSETRAIQAEIPTKLVGNLSHSVCWKAFPQPLSEGYTIHNLAACSIRITDQKFNKVDIYASTDAPADIIYSYCQITYK